MRPPVPDRADAEGIPPPDNRFLEALHHVAKAFENPPKLDFERVQAMRPQIEYDFPAIKPDTRSSGVLTRDIGRFHEQATGKFHYHDFWVKPQDVGLTWPNERLLHRANAYRVTEQEQNLPDDIVNSTKESAELWFRDEIIDVIAEAEERICICLLGKPGAGKSTLLKYLVNSQRAHSNERRVIFSRFETAKFREILEERLGTVGGGPMFGAVFLKAILDYIHTIVLRDLLFNEAYCVLDEGVFPKRDHPFFTSGGVEALTFAASEIEVPGHEQAPQAAYEVEQARQSAFRILRNAVRNSRRNPNDKMLDYREFLNLDTLMRVRLVKHLIEGKQVCIIFDGLDFLTTDDTDMDPQKYKVLTSVMRLFGFNIEALGFPPLRLGFDIHAIIPLRPNTFWELHDRTVPPEAKISLSKIITRRVTELSPRVVLYRALFRGLRSNSVYRARSEAELAEAVDGYFTFVNSVMRVIGVQFGMGHDNDHDSEVLSLFNGNLRDCFDFLARILFWLKDESQSKDAGLSLGTRVGSSLPDLFEFAATRPARRLLARRGYRLVEHMLFFSTSTFQNALKVERSGLEGSIGGNRIISRNGTCRGLVDNVFNYHSLDHANFNGNHKLLQKVRILQILCEAGSVSLEDVMAAMHNFGYDAGPKSDIADALKVLRYVGFIMPTTEAGRTSYQVTTKGRIVVTGLVYKAAYLEHVFHASLLPKLLMRWPQDVPRVEGSGDWAVNSIRNYFTLLCYIRSIEDFRTNDKIVPAKYRVWPTMRVSVFTAVERILRRDWQEKGHQDPGTWFVTRAQGIIDALTGAWQNEGIVQ